MRPGYFDFGDGFGIKPLGLLETKRAQRRIGSQFDGRSFHPVTGPLR